MGIGELRVIDTGLDPVTAEREQWDDGNNTLAHRRPGSVCAYERNMETNARLAEEGIEVVLIAGSELGTRPRRPALHVLPGAARPVCRAQRRPRGAASRVVGELQAPLAFGMPA